MKTKTKELMDHIMKEMNENNIPGIFICGDMQTKETGIIIDDRQEYRDLYTAILVDLITQQHPQARQLLNVVLNAACMVISQHESLQKRATDLINQMKAAQHQEVLIYNKAEA